MTYHSEVVGSLLRPAYLVEARKQLEAGQMNPAEFKAIEDRAVNEAIALQEGAGIDVITDGEQRRYAFFGHLIDSLDGFDKYGGWAIPFRDESGEQLVLKRPVVVERLSWRRSMCSEEWVYLRSRKASPGKVTMISAQQAAAYYDPEKSRSAYPTRDAYLADIVDFSRREVDELIRLGCNISRSTLHSTLHCLTLKCEKAIASVEAIQTR
jgi:5-methyltetrahydropteroyltriglutamate--homocysteine methyltransferase